MSGSPVGENKVGKALQIYGAVLIIGIFITVIVYSFLPGSKKPLRPGEEKHWQDPAPGAVHS